MHPNGRLRTAVLVYQSKFQTNQKLEKLTKLKKDV